MAYNEWLTGRTIKVLLRAKREARGNNQLTEELNKIQRLHEAEHGEFGVVLCDEYSCEEGYSPEFD